MGSGVTGGHGYHLRVYLPAGLECTHTSPCTLQWTYVTGNSYDSYPEVFRNCADFSLTGTTSGTAPAPVPPSVPAPEPQSEPQATAKPTAKPTATPPSTPSPPATSPEPAPSSEPVAGGCAKDADGAIAPERAWHNTCDELFAGTANAFCNTDFIA